MPHNPNDPNEEITQEQLDAIAAMNKAQSWIVVVALPNPADPRHPYTQLYYSDSIAIGGLLDEGSMIHDGIQAISAELHGFDDDPLYDDDEELPEPPP